MSSQFRAMTQAQMFAIPDANLINLDFYFATDTRNTYIVLFNSLVLLSEFLPSFTAGITGPQGVEGPTGPEGPAGSDGSAWREGSGVPSSGLGANGDFYLNGVTGDVYTKTSGSWGSPVANIKGAPGPAGSTTLAGCTDVSESSPANGDVLTYVSSGAKWENKPGFTAPAFPRASAGPWIAWVPSGSTVNTTQLSGPYSSQNNGSFGPATVSFNSGGAYTNVLRLGSLSGGGMTFLDGNGNGCVSGQPYLKCRCSFPNSGTRDRLSIYPPNTTYRWWLGFRTMHR